MDGDREKAIDAGCDDYDTKPLDLSRLIEKMTLLLSQSSSAMPTLGPIAFS